VGRDRGGGDYRKGIEIGQGRKKSSLRLVGEMRVRSRRDGAKGKSSVVGESQKM